MLRFLAFVISLSFIRFDLHAQEQVQWASRVLEVSSEWSHPQYAGLQALGKPNVFPGYGDNPNAWRPRKDHKTQFIVVLFDDPMQAQQVVVAESWNPGSVTHIYAYDTDDREHLLFETKPVALPTNSRLLNIFFEKTEFEIVALRVEMDVTAVPGGHSIDAIGISSSRQPIGITIQQDTNRGDVLVSALGEEVNSSHHEQGPLLSLDGDRLYFSRKQHPENVGGTEDLSDIWYSERDPTTGLWSEAKNLGPPLNNEGPNFISDIIPSGDEQILLLGNNYKKNGRMSPGVSMARILPDGTITKPKNLVIENDYNYSPKADYSISADQQVLLLSVERDGTQGARDLYASFDNGKKWSEPVTLGTVINSAGDEIAPHLAPDGYTLYFASTGFSGYGGYDIYKSTRLDDSWVNWSEPQNIGEGYNSSSDDIHYYSSGTQSGYVVRRDSLGNEDVLKFEVLEESPDTTPLVAEIEGDESATDPIYNQPVPVEPTATHITQIAFFEFNEVHLTPGDQSKLNDLLKFFQSGVIRSVEIHAHTDSVGSSYYNLELSKRRGSSIKSFFINNGVESDRIQVVAAGESDPLVPNSSDEFRAINRRVEFKFELSQSPY